MGESESAKVFSETTGADKQLFWKEPPSRPWLFQEENLSQARETAKTIGKETLTNKLNHINFLDRAILVHLRHHRYKESILVRAFPEPCLGSKINCRMSDENLLGHDFVNYQFLHLVIDDGQSMILAPAALLEIDRHRFTVRLPEKSYVLGKRNARRYLCREVTAEVMQSGFHASGELLDFSPVGFRIRVRPEASCSFHWFNPDESVTIQLRRNEQIVFSGACRCIREWGGVQEREIVLSPGVERINRFRKKPIRNIRQQLVPSPTVTFNHPFFRKRVQLEVTDISTSGFSVHEKLDESLLIPGMIISDLTINYAGALRMKCSAQVIHRHEEEGKGMRSGFAILDMPIETYSRLTHILANSLDSHAHISNEVDLDALWEFFFEAGFLYPMKYRLIQPYRENFKETYRKLYEENPEIAGHFTYQENGRIYGHISMVRAYEQAWMIHHHAARTTENKRAGLVVLKQIMHYLNDMCRLPSAKMDYVMSFFRPENRFPNAVFGGFARSLKNPQGCSMDLFCYLPYTSLSLGAQLPQGWSLQECSAKEVWELNHFYRHNSGGRLLNALGLIGGEDRSEEESLEATYNKLGFLREWKAYSLTHEGELNAVLIVNQSNLGFNLSELLNSIMILVTNPERLPWNVLSIAIGQLTGIHDMNRVPILFYPFEYVKAKDVPYEKQYNLWILDVQYGNEYMEYMQRRFRIRQ